MSILILKSIAFCQVKKNINKSSACLISLTKKYQKIYNSIDSCIQSSDIGMTICAVQACTKIIPPGKSLH